jgi:hypothetical protein
MNRIIRRVRIDVLDAITAIRMGEWRYALPSFIFNRIDGGSA